MSKKYFSKIVILLLCMILIFSSGFPLQAMSPRTIKDVTSQVELLGNPFNKATFAKNVWDMQVYNGRIYLGHGDYNSNAGPIPIIYFDPDTNKFVTQFTVNEEQIYNYKVLNGKLYIPGTDARDSWDYGNFYVMDNGQWTKYRTIPNANHVFDMAYFKGQLYAATGTTKPGWGEVLMSKDLGKTWISQVPQTKNSFITMGDWTTALFEMNGKLYATGQMVFPPDSCASFFAKYRNILVMDGNNSEVQIYNNLFFPGASINYYYNMLRTSLFNNNLIYLGVITGGAIWSPSSMYAATSLVQSRRIVFPITTTFPTDILVRDTNCYVLAYIKNSNSNYINIVYKSTDLQSWTEFFRFNSNTFARSFEELNGDFYFGLGCSTDVLPASTGNILKVAKKSY